MKKYYLGEFQNSNGEKGRIYYYVNYDKFIAIKANGEKLKLSIKQQKNLYKKYQNKCKKLKLELYIKRAILISAMGYSLFRLDAFLQNQKDASEILQNLKKEYGFDEDLVEEIDIKELIELCYKSIEKNPNFTKNQKEYLKTVWTQYIQEKGHLFFEQTILEIKNLSTVKVEYKPYENNNITARHIKKTNTIILYTPYASNEDLFHETVHCFIGDRLTYDFTDLEEGYCGALERKYCNSASYKEENEYLLLISEIIGKEKLEKYLINGEENALIENLADVTNTSVKEIQSIISKTFDYRITDLDEKLRRENLEKEIKQELAELAIKADSQNQENFIVLNAYYDKYELDSSFLNEEYLYTYLDENKVYLIDESNKYDYVYLFEDELTLTKSKTNR